MPPSGQRLESHTKTLMEVVSTGINYIPLPMIGEGLGEWFEAPSYEEGVGVDGVSEGLPSDGVWGYPPARDEYLAVCPCQWYPPA